MNTGESRVRNWGRTRRGLGELGALGQAGGEGARLEGGGRQVEVGQDRGYLGAPTAESGLGILWGTGREAGCPGWWNWGIVSGKLGAGLGKDWGCLRGLDCRIRTGVTEEQGCRGTGGAGGRIEDTGEARLGNQGRTGSTGQRGWAGLGVLGDRAGDRQTGRVGVWEWGARVVGSSLGLEEGSGAEEIPVSRGSAEEALPGNLPANSLANQHGSVVLTPLSWAFPPLSTWWTLSFGGDTCADSSRQGSRDLELFLECLRPCWCCCCEL